MALEPNFNPLPQSTGISKEMLHSIGTNIQSDGFNINQYKIDPLEPLSQPKVCLSVIKNEQSATLATLGNFSLVIGKAKSRKSFLITLFIAALATKEIILDCLHGTTYSDQDQVLYFDTEQSKYHVQKAFKRICRLIGIDVPTNIHAYFLRGLKPLDRRNEIEKVINSRNDVAFVVIDGIRDLVTSINDEEQATEIASWLLRITQEKNIHIVTVLHQNKNDSNARGHLGTELVNKAETTLSVTKSDQDKEISIVEAEYCRDKEPEPFAFEINDFGIPQIAENWSVRTSKKNERFDVNELDDFNNFKVLKEALSNGKELSYAELVRQVKLAFKSVFKKPIGDNKAKDLITYYKNQNWLIQTEKKAPYSLGEFS